MANSDVDMTAVHVLQARMLHSPELCDQASILLDDLRSRQTVVPLRFPDGMTATEVSHLEDMRRRIAKFFAVPARMLSPASKSGAASWRSMLGDRHG